LLRYDGSRVKNLAEFIHRRRGEGKRDAPRKLELLRDGKEMTVLVAPGLLRIGLNNRVPAKATKSGKQ
jgi:hypothetical protein